MIDTGHEYADGLLERLEAELNAVYSQAYTEIKKKQRKYMDSYESQLKKKQEQLKKGKIKKEQLEAWQRNQLIGAEWYKRMSETLSDDMVTTDKKAASIINGYTPDAYAENANFGAYQIERQGNVDTSFTLYDRETVEMLIAERPDLLPYVEIDETKDKRWNKSKFTSAITQSVLQGEGIPDAAKRLITVVGMGKAASIRSARTAITGAENAGRIDSYKRAQAMGIKLKKEWVATLDKRTRDSHARLDGEKVDIDKKFSNGLMYPGDPNGVPGEVYNCRCTVVADVDGVDQSDAKRNSKLGSMSYEEWKKGEWRKAKSEKAGRGRTEKAGSGVKTSYTVKQLSAMSREELIPIAREVARKNAGSQGITEDEALRRFDLLVSSNTTPQIRKYINQKGK